MDHGGSDMVHDQDTLGDDATGGSGLEDDKSSDADKELR
jgi:hypothetical protein